MTTPKSYRVGDIMELVRDPVSVDSATNYTEIGVRSFGRGIFHKGLISGADLGGKKVYWIRRGELVFNTVFAWEGAVAVTGADETGKIGSHRFMTYQVDSEVAEVHYLYYYFCSEQGLAAAAAASPGSAGRNRTLGIKAFAAQQVELPGISEQRRIVAKLDRNFQSLRELLSNREGQSSGAVFAYLQAIDNLTDSAAQARARVSDMAEVTNDLVRPGDDPAPADSFIGLEHIKGNIGVRTGQRALGNEKGRKFRFCPGDVLYGYLRPYQNKVWLADSHGLCSVEQFVLRFSELESARYFSHVLRGRRVLSRVNRLTNNLQLPRLRSSQLLETIVPVPGPAMAAVLRELDALQKKVVRVLELVEKRDAQVDALRPSLLNAAFSGQL